MNAAPEPRVESETMPDFARLAELDELTSVQSAREPNKLATRLNLDADHVKKGLGQLALTLIKILHDLLERQAIRRIESGSLSEEQIERIGLTLMRQAEEIERLRKDFNLEEEDLVLDLGPLGRNW